MKKRLFLLVFIATLITLNVQSQDIHWESKADLPISNWSGSAIEYNNKIYYLGGGSQTGYDSTIFEFSPIENEWIAKAKFPTNGGNFACVVVDSIIHAIGLQDDNYTVHKKYNITTDTWSDAAPMPTYRQHIEGVEINGKIYVVGGAQNLNTVLNINEVYDTKTNTWTEKAPMPVGVHAYGAAAYNGKMYIFGGDKQSGNNIWTFTKLVQVYDPVSDSWEQLPDMPVYKENHGVAVIEDKIFLIGGFIGNNVTSRVDIFYPETGTWVTSNDFPIKITTMGCASDNKSLYIIAGTGGPSNDWSTYSYVYEGKIDYITEDSLYLGQTPPGNTPEVFARNILSSDNQEHGSPSFSPDGKEVFWQTNFQEDNEWVCNFWTMRWEGKNWGTPELSAFGGIPIYTNDGARIYFESSSNSCDGLANGPYYADKEGSEWGEQKSTGLVDSFPEIQYTYNLSRANNGAFYFLGEAIGSGLQDEMGIFKSELIDGKYVKPELLSSNINKAGKFNWTPFISTDESYLIFATNHGTNSSDYDLYISFKADDNNWSDAISFGEIINTGKQERYPKVSPDGKFLFFTRDNPPHSEDIFWVSASIIEDLRIIAFSPEMINQIPDTNITINSILNFVIPENTFRCEYGIETLDYTASLANGSALPSWLTFNSDTEALTGTPIQTGVYSIKITATNTDSVSASCTFIISVGTTGINSVEGENIKVFPNPANQNINIEGLSDKKVIYQISNTNGVVIKQDELYSNIINITDLNHGVYLLQLKTGDKLIISKTFVKQDSQ